jgi:hypothetical protein
VVQRRLATCGVGYFVYPSVKSFSTKREELAKIHFRELY